MRLPRHTPSLDALTVACGRLVLGLVFAAAAVPTASSQSADFAEQVRATMAAGRTTPAAASGVVTFSALIAEELRRPQSAGDRGDRRRVEQESGERSEVDQQPNQATLADQHPVARRPALPSTGPSPVPTATFGAVQGSSSVPPDTTGAVGPSQVLTVTNHGLQAHTKSGALIGAVSTWTFWAMFNPAFPFDPRVIYDPVQQRFIVIALDYRSNGQTIDNSSIYVAVSHSGDVLGGWTLRKYVACEPCGGGFADFPMVGLSQNFLAVTVNFSRTFVFSYPALRQPQGPAPVTVLDTAGPGYFNFWGAPVVSASATDGDLYFVKSNSGVSGDFRLNRLTGPPDAPSFTSGPLITVPSHLSQVGCIPGNAPQAPEPGTGNVVTITNVPINSDAVARDDYVWFTESRRVSAGDCGGHARVLWLKFHKAGTFVDGGVIEDATGKWFMYPTIAVNRFHDVLVGFTQTSASEYASAAYAFRASTDPAGTMRDARVYKPGEGHFNLPYSAGVGRWGDYSHTVVDPSDDTTLWTIQEYARAQVGTGAGSGRWGTWWAAVNPRAAQPPGAPRTLQAAATGSSVLLTWAAPTDGGAPTSYSIEAGSGPGAANVANLATGSTAVAFGAGGVPDGTYYVRVRASNGVGISAPSNEVTLVVGCTAAPGAPSGLTIVANSAGIVTLAWTQSSGQPSSYIVEAGRSSGLADLVTIDLGSANPAMTAHGVAAGTYFVRVRGRNRCGIGPASNEIALVVP
jgi:hypothetical protein